MWTATWRRSRHRRCTRRRTTATTSGRDPARPAVEWWGRIPCALAPLEATPSDAWEIVPGVKGGRHPGGPAKQFLRSLQRVTPQARFVEVPVPNNRVTLRYHDA